MSRTRVFVAVRGGGIAARASIDQRLAIAQLLDDVAELLSDDPMPDDDPTQDDEPARAAAPGPDWARLEASLQVEAPSDPAVARLLPSGNRQDPDLAQSYRRLTEQSLRRHKQSAAAVAAAALRRPDPAVLTPNEAQSLLTSLADARLVLGERLEVRTDEDTERLWQDLDRLDGRLAQLPADDPAWAWARAVSTFEALAWWQQELIRVLPLARPGRSGPD